MTRWRSSTSAQRRCTTRIRAVSSIAMSNPSNIMLTQDSDVRIIDFGIALVSDSDISRIEGIAGSPSYMSPEQVQSLELSNRSDLYSLGAVMYELLTGSRPFRAGNLQKTAASDRLCHRAAPSIPCARTFRRIWRTWSQWRCRRNPTSATAAVWTLPPS